MVKNLLLTLIDDNNKHKVRLYDYLHFDLNNRIYSYGSHFKSPYESFRHQTFKEKVKMILYSMAVEAMIWFQSFRNQTKGKSVIISNAYFDLGGKIKEDKIAITKVPWVIGRNQPLVDRKIFRKGAFIRKKLKNASFKELLEEDFEELVKAFGVDLKEFIRANNVKALFLPQDIGFFEKQSIDIFKELGLPSFCFIHGLPGIYNSIDYNRTDFLVVWGGAIKENFVKAGIKPEKILVNGHPKYLITSSEELRFNFDDVLIITKSLNGSQFSDRVVLADRSNLIYYVFSIKRVLQKFGVTKVRIRPHPSENYEWYQQYLEDDFFTLDTSDFQTSLKKSTLVIGGTSTTFLEAIIAGVNYTVYEPVTEDNKLIDNFYSVPPFDGSCVKVPVAKSETELEYILQNKTKVNPEIVKEYINPSFDPSVVLTLISH